MGGLLEYHALQLGQLSQFWSQLASWSQPVLQSWLQSQHVKKQLSQLPLQSWSQLASSQPSQLDPALSWRRLWFFVWDLSCGGKTRNACAVPGSSSNMTFTLDAAVLPAGRGRSSAPTPRTIDKPTTGQLNTSGSVPTGLACSFVVQSIIVHLSVNACLHAFSSSSSATPSATALDDLLREYLRCRSCDGSCGLGSVDRTDLRESTAALVEEPEMDFPSGALEEVWLPDCGFRGFSTLRAGLWPRQVGLSSPPGVQQPDMTSRRREAARQAPRQIFRGHSDAGDQASSARST